MLSNLDVSIDNDTGLRNSHLDVVVAYTKVLIPYTSTIEQDTKSWSNQRIRSTVSRWQKASIRRYEESQYKIQTFG
jgi:hypothetical protein